MRMKAKEEFKFRGLPVRIFIVVLVSGLLSMMMIWFMCVKMSRMSAQYEQMMEDQVQTREDVMEISGKLYEHRAVIIDCFLIDKNRQDGKKREKMIERENTIRAELQKLFENFQKKTNTDDKEILYHSVYSSFQSYLKTVEVAEKLFYDGNTKAALSYVSSRLLSGVNFIEENMKKLDEYSEKEMLDAKGEMEHSVMSARVHLVVGIAVTIIAVGVSLFYSVRVTMMLENQRSGLQKEVAVKNKELRQHSEKLLDVKDQTIVGMANLIENRDGDTGEHIMRTRMYVGMIAREARDKGYFTQKLTDEYIELLEKAAPMHDVGKIVVPDHILKKPGRLTPEEFEQIKRHASEGGRIVREVLGNIEDNEYVEMASEIAQGHHEKWDGSGYPEGKKGNEIPLCARIMAVADVYDALVSKRCYKDSMGCDRAMEIIEESAGSHFDPVLAKVFVEMKEKIRKISDESVD